MKNKTYWLSDQKTANDYIATLHKFQKMEISFRKLEDEGEQGAHDDFDIDYKIEQGRVARVFIQGGMHHRKSFMTSYLNIPTYDEIKRLLIALEQSELINSVVLDIDSGGGDTHGCFELADYIHSYKKPIKTESRGNLASAAYLLASATNSISVSETAEVGCIGAVAIFPDPDDPNASKRIIFRSAGSENKNQLKGDGANQYQEYVNDVGKTFSDRLKAFRGNGDSFKGEIFSGVRSLDISLVDSIIPSIRSNTNMNEKSQDSLTSLEKNQMNMNSQASEYIARLEAQVKELQIKSESLIKLESERVVAIMKAAGIDDRIVKAVSEKTDAGTFAISEIEKLRNQKTENDTKLENLKKGIQTDADAINGTGTSDLNMTKNEKSFSHEDYISVNHGNTNSMTSEGEGAVL